jgi:ABC-type transport system involved in multi-copper enzyme maturation permease subunit
VTDLVRDVMEDVRHTFLAFRFELLKDWGRLRVLLGCLLSLGVPALLYLVPKIAGAAFPSAANLFVATSVSFVGTLVVVTAAYYGGDALSTEIDKRTYLVAYVAPQRRSSLLAGKFLAGLSLIIFNLALYYGVTVWETSAIYGAGALPSSLPTSFAVSCLYAATALSFAFFFSSFLRSAITSTLVSLFTLTLILPIIEVVLTLVSINPWFLPDYSAGLITQVLGYSGALTQAESVAGYASTFAPGFTTSLQVLAGWAMGLLPVSALLSASQEAE